MFILALCTSCGKNGSDRRGNYGVAPLSRNMHHATMASPLAHLDRGSFGIAVVSGLVGAVAGGAGWTVTAVVSGLLAAAAPIAGRVATQKIAKRAEVKANAKIALATKQANSAVAELEQTRRKLGPRRLTEPQAQALFAALLGAEGFPVTIAENRHELEPALLHQQITHVFETAGFQVAYYGGMNNNTTGIEVGGPESPHKALVTNAIAAAGLDYISSDASMLGNVTIWIGTHPGLATPDQY
jgi:hypothetical protein